jgi:parallel beta-helix repeat protein
VIGAGTTNVIEQYGIQFGGIGEERRIKGRVSDNQVTDNRTDGTTQFPAAGIFTGRSNANQVRVKENVLENNQIGIQLYLSTGTRAEANRISGPRKGAVGMIGVGVSGTNNRVVDNRLRNLEIGIKLFNSEENGTAVDTRIDDNHFRGVTSQVVADPGASAAAPAVRTSAAPIGRKWK